MPTPSLAPEELELESGEILEVLPEAVAVTTASGKLLFVNPAFATQLDATVEALVGQSVDDLVAPEDTLSLVGFGSAFSEPVRDLQVLFQSPGGDPQTVLVSSSPWDFKGQHRLVVLAARPAGELQAELADTTRWAALEQDKATELARAHDAIEIKNKALEETQAELQETVHRLHAEIQIRTKLEDELRLAQKLEAIGQLASGIAHEINTPLQYVGDNVAFTATAFEQVTQFVQTCMELASDSTIPPKRRSRIEYMLRETPLALAQASSGLSKVTEIVRAMKSFAHMGSDEFVGSDINSMIGDTLTVARNEYKQVAEVSTELGVLPPVLCNPGQLNQVLLNLLVNAAHAIADKGAEGLGQIHIASRADGEYVEITLSDTGGGIPEAVQGRIFEPFFTTKDVGRGSGQGLALARSIIQEGHGGEIRFETEAGVGTTFFIRLRVAGKPVAATSGVSNVPPAA